MPAGTFLIIDVNPDSICWPYFGMRMDRDSFFNFPNSSHSRAGWFPSPTAMSSTISGATTEPSKPIRQNYHNHDDASPRNPDLDWLRQRTTVLP